MDMTVKKEMSRKKKNAPGVCLRPDMKYRTMLKVMVLAILYGKSHIIDATASADG